MWDIREKASSEGRKRRWRITRMRSQYYEYKLPESHKLLLSISKLKLGQPDLVLRLNTVIDDRLDCQSSACSRQRTIITGPASLVSNSQRQKVSGPHGGSSSKRRCIAASCNSCRLHPAADAMDAGTTATCHPAHIGERRPLKNHMTSSTGETRERRIYNWNLLQSSELLICSQSCGNVF